jgi:hypothetical protein
MQPVKVIKTLFENMAKFKYLGMTVANKNYINKDLKAYEIQSTVTTIQFKFYLIISYVKA